MVKVPEAKPFLRAIAPIVTGINHLVQRTDIEGLERIPREGPAIIIGNHTVYSDSLIMGEAILRAGRAPHFVSGSDFYDIPGVATILRGVHAIKVERNSATAGDSLAGIRQVLDDGGVVLIFPEGGLTHDPNMWPMRGKTGVARLMSSHPHVPVIPAAHWGNERLLNPWDMSIDWRNIGKNTRMKLVFGPPLDFGVSATPDYAELTEATERMMRVIDQLLIPLRAEHPLCYDPTPPTTRWQSSRNGDPLNDEYELNRYIRNARSTRRRRARRRLLSQSSAEVK